MYHPERLTINPLAYADLVNEEAFFASVSVNVQKAKQYVGETALKAISEKVGSPPSHGV